MKRNTGRGPIARENFRIRPARGSRRFFVVHVARDVPALRKELRRCGLQRDVGRTFGCCVGARGSGRYRHLLGMVFVPRDYAGAGFVAHELAHAAFRALERRGQVVHHVVTGPGDQRASASEERYCEVAEHLNRDFWRQWYAHGYDRE